MPSLLCMGVLLTVVGLLCVFATPEAVGRGCIWSPVVVGVVGVGGPAISWCILLEPVSPISIMPVSVPFPLQERCAR